MLPSQLGDQDINRRRIFSVLVLLLIVVVVVISARETASGSNIAAIHSSAPLLNRVNYPIKSDVSRPLRSIKPIAPAKVPAKNEVENYTLQPKTNNLSKDPLWQNWFSPLAMPTPIQNFESIYNYWGIYPPDTDGDVGPNHYVSMDNLGFQIFTKTGISLYGPANNNTLWSGFGAECETHNDGDPIILYDSIANRWLLSQFAVLGTAGGQPTYECIAVSSSPDPTGSYYRYQFQSSAAFFEDYPHIGVWPDGYYMTTNEFATALVGAGNFAFERDKMLVGDPTARMVYFHLSTPDAGLLPTDFDGTILPPAGSPNFFLEPKSPSVNGNGVLSLYKFHVDWTNPQLSTFTGPTAITVAPWDNDLCPATREQCIDQPNTSIKLEATDDRFMHKLAYRNFGDHESLVVNQTVDADGAGHAGIRWYEIRTPNGVLPTLYQQGTYAPDTTHRWMGSMGMDRQGNIAVGFSASSTSIYPSLRYAGRLASDPLGALSQGEATLFAGTGSQTGVAARWGDYSALSIDPSDDCTFWYTNEYLQTMGERNWRTRVGSFKFPGCITGPPPPTVTGTPPTNTPTHTATSTPQASPTPCAGGATYSDSITNSDPTQVGRLNRTGIPSTCSVPKVCPGITDSIPRHYKTYTYTNSTSIDQCVTVSIVSNCGNNALLSAAYLTSFNPNDLCANYLADMGVAGPTFSYSFNLAVGATVIITVNEADAGAGCANYVLSINPCAVGTPTSTVTGTPPTNTPTGTATSTSTSTGTATNTPTSTNTPCATSIPLFEDFESGTLGAFTATTTIGTSPWHVTTDSANSGIYSAFVADPDEQADQQLTLINAVNIPSSATEARLTFAHKFNFEQPEFDGGVLEYSTDGGTVWTDAGALITSAGYTGVITVASGNPLSGRAAFVDQSPGFPSFETANVNLFSLKGQSVKFRFRMGSDLNTGVQGWWVDDVSVYIGLPCTPPTITTTPALTSTPTNTPVPCGTNINYVITQSAAATIVPGTTLVAGSQCNSCMSDIYLPFNVKFYGGTRNYIGASTNGTLQFYCCNSTSSNVCLPTSSLDDTIFAFWDGLTMDPGICGAGCGVYTSMSGVIPDRIFNIEYRAHMASNGSVVNFEVRVYEGQNKFDIIYATVGDGGTSATVGVQKDIGQQFYTQYECNTGGLTPGLQLTFSQPTCPPFLVGHVNWEGRPSQPSLTQQLPLTLTLRSSAGGSAAEYSNLSTDASGFFTVSVGDLLPGAYNYRTQGPDASPGGNITPGWLAVTGTLVLSGGAVTEAEMGNQPGGDCDNDNAVDLADFTTLKSTFGKTSTNTGYDPTADYTGDSSITLSDFNVVKTNFGKLGAQPIRPAGR